MTHADALASNIRSQPETVAGVIDYHASAGRTVLDEAARAIHASQHLVLFAGMGSSYFASIAAVKYLTRHGKAAHVLEASELLHGALPAYRGGVVVLVSRSGESVEVVQALAPLKDRQNLVIGVTDNSDSTLARQADIALSIHSRPDNMVAIQSYSATLVTLLHLAESATGTPGAWDGQPDAMNSVISAFMDASAEWEPFLAPAQALYLLGRGASLATVGNGALMFHEIAKFPAVGMEAGQFRHGPLEVSLSAKQIPVLVFTPRGDTQTLNLALAADLHRLGMQARHIGPDPGSIPAQLHWPVPFVTEIAAPVLEILPVQIAAYRLAGWRGFDAGHLQITPQVTTTESGVHGEADA